jgi:hypothetical protein
MIILIDFNHQSSNLLLNFVKYDKKKVNQSFSKYHIKNIKNKLFQGHWPFLGKD